MDTERIQPVFFEAPSRGERTWVYPWIGIVLGVAVGIFIGHPLAMVAYDFQQCLIRGTVCNVTGALFHSFHLQMWPMMLTFSVFGGITFGIIGFVLKYLRENRLRLDTLQKEFELQVATLRHQYKNLAIGIHGFSGRIKRKMGNIEEQVQECARDCPTYKNFHRDFESLAKNVDVLEEAAQRLTHTLGQELLFLKALTSNTLIPVPQDFYRLLTQCIQDLKGLRFREKEIKFTFNGNPLEECCPGGLVFPFEPYTMEVILQNILANAMKFGDFIQIRVSETRNQVQVEVQDNGPGMEVEKLRHSLLTPADRKEESTHLGLRVSLHLLSKIGGRLGAWNVPGSGAAFILEFPK